MTWLRPLVDFLVSISVLIAVVANYLIINKLWKRKHLKDVAESISISAALLGIATSAPLLAHFILLDQMKLVIKNSVGILTGVIFVLIGAGIWVRENRGRTFREMLRGALNLERKESSYLIRAMTQPKGAEQILRILELMVKLDRHVHEQELVLLREFAERWKIEVPDLERGAVAHDGHELDIREAVRTYLDLTPPHEQAAQLGDLLRLFARADEEVSREERIVLEEIEGMIEQYVSEDTLERHTYEVVIVPQSEKQFEAARELLPGAELRERRGGRVITVGNFFSRDYAETVCQKYISLGLFTAQVSS